MTDESKTAGERCLTAAAIGQTIQAILALVILVWSLDLITAVVMGSVAFSAGALARGLRLRRKQARAASLIFQGLFLFLGGLILLGATSCLTVTNLDAEPESGTALGSTIRTAITVSYIYGGIQVVLSSFILWKLTRRGVAEACDNRVAG